MVSVFKLKDGVLWKQTCIKNILLYHDCFEPVCSFTLAHGGCHVPLVYIA